jgi:hypothetical protein
MGVNNPDCARIIVESRDPAYAKSDFNDFVNDNLPNLSFEHLLMSLLVIRNAFE